MQRQFPADAAYVPPVTCSDLFEGGALFARRGVGNGPKVFVCSYSSYPMFGMVILNWFVYKTEPIAWSAALSRSNASVSARAPSCGNERSCMASIAVLAIHSAIYWDLNLSL